MESLSKVDEETQYSGRPVNSIFLYKNSSLVHGNSKFVFQTLGFFYLTCHELSHSLFHRCNECARERFNNQVLKKRRIWLLAIVTKCCIGAGQYLDVHILLLDLIFKPTVIFTYLFLRINDQQIVFNVCTKHQLVIYVEFNTFYLLKIFT